LTRIALRFTFGIMLRIAAICGFIAMLVLWLLIWSMHGWSIG